MLGLKVKIIIGAVSLVSSALVIAGIIKIIYMKKASSKLDYGGFYD